MIIEKGKAVIYCRVAYAGEAEIQSQITFVLDFAKSKGYEINADDYYCDNGVSGITLNRPEMNRLLLDIRSGNISVIVAKDLGRLMRDYVLLDTFLNEAQKYNVEVITMDNYTAMYEMRNSLAAILQNMNVAMI